MAEYEIRLRKSAQTSIFRTVQTSDFAAISCARKVAADGDSVEVWKGMERIFVDSPHYIISLTQAALTARDTMKGWLAPRASTANRQARF